MKNCRSCRKKQCEYKGKAFKNMTIYCDERCVLEIKEECERIATEDFRRVIKELAEGNFEMPSVKGILRQAECILNAADGVMAEGRG